LLDAGDSLRAEQYALLALREGQPEEPVRSLLVHACLRSFRLRAALDYAEPFLRHHPGHARLRYLVATIQLALGQPRLARRELERVSGLAPAFPEAHYLAGVIARDTFGDAARAREAFERYLALTPDGEHAEELRAWLAEPPSPPEPVPEQPPAPALDEGS
jgi:tetratricopeptide (TPR) repeat protein